MCIAQGTLLTAPLPSDWTWHWPSQQQLQGMLAQPQVPQPWEEHLTVQISSFRVCFDCVAEDLTHSKYPEFGSPVRISHIVLIENYSVDQCRMAITGYMCQIRTFSPQSVCEITHSTLTGMLSVCNCLWKRAVSPWKDSLSLNRINSQAFQL